RTWLDGKSLGYKVKHSEDEEELIASLNRINPNFDDFRNLDDAQSWRYHIRVVRGVHSAINRYLRNSNSNLKIASQEKIEDDIDDLDDSSVSSPLSFISGTSSSAVNISALAEEIREQFMGDFDENYSFATITKMNPIKRNIKNYLKLEGLEGKLGDYGHLDFNLDGMEEKTYRDLFEQNLILRRYMIEITNLVIRSYFRDKNEDSIENVKGAFLNYLLSYNEGIEHFKSLPESEQRILKNLFENTIFNPKVDEFLNLEPGSVRKLAHLVFQGQSLFPYFVRRIIMKESLNDSPAMSTSDFISEDELRAFKKVMGFPFEYIDQNPQGFKLVGPQSNVELYNYFKERYGYSDDIIDRFSQRYPILFTTYYTRREVLDVLEPCGLENLIEFNPDYFILDKEYHADLIRKRNQYRKDKERKERRDSLAANYRANKSWLKNAEKGHRLLVNRIVEDPDLIEEGLEYVDVELGMEGAWARVDIIYRDVQGNDLLVEVKQNAYKNGGNFDNGMKAVEQVVGYRTAYEARRRLEHLRESKQFNGKKIRGMLVAHQIGDLEREVLGTMGCEYRIVPKI
ncbi:MAG: hypothetical protein KC550_05490, partial [Nanoarchaeota archaeon]|nr:hypothetical protein [Nanoarchaeota archaeon]